MSKVKGDSATSSEMMHRVFARNEKISKTLTRQESQYQKRGGEHLSGALLGFQVAGLVH